MKDGVVIIKLNEQLQGTEFINKMEEIQEILANINIVENKVKTIKEKLSNILNYDEFEVSLTYEPHISKYVRKNHQAKQIKCNYNQHYKKPNLVRKVIL